MPDQHANFAISAVATAPSPATSGTSLVVTTGHGTRFPTAPFNATIWPAASQPDPSNAEIVRVTAVSTDTLTITRAQESTSARTVVVGDQIAATITAKTLTDAESQSQALAVQQGIIAISGDPSVGITTGTSQGTGKILTARLPWGSRKLVTNLHVSIGTGGATLTAGQNLAALYDSSGNLLSGTTTPDQSSTWTTGGDKTMALTTPVTLDADPNGYLYYALLTVGTTIPLWRAMPGTAALSNIFIASNVGQRGGILAASGLTSMPSTITLTTMTQARIPVVGVS